MRPLTLGTSVVVALITGLALVRSADAQTLAYEESERGPRFLLASVSTSKPAPVDVSRTPILKRRLSLALDGVSVKQALAEISAQSGLELTYSDDAIPAGSRVHLRTDGISVAAALTEVLLDASIDVVFKSGMRAALVRRPLLQLGSIVGRVTDRRSGAGLEDALVQLEGTGLGANTGPDGSYRITNVPPETYDVSARRIGYQRHSQSVTVAPDQEATADFALEQAPTQLEELVTTGTLLPTEVKAVPTPVSIITEEEIARQRPRTIQQLLRHHVPTAVSWDAPAFPTQTVSSVRGASSLVAGIGQVKVFVDGIEATSPTVAAVDPNSIARVEVVRGPQAAAIYGSDAIGGVMQIFTKRGGSNLSRPLVDGEVGIGLIQTPYEGFGEVLRQQYKASVRGGDNTVSYNLGANYSRTDDYVPAGEDSRQSNPSAYGGIRFAGDIVSLDVSGRYYSHELHTVFNPELYETGFAPFSRPNHQPTTVQNQTLGARLEVAPITWWRNTLTIGVDRFTTDLSQTQPRLTTPDDTLLLVFNESATKTSIGLATSLAAPLGAAMSGSLTLGLDHWSLPSTSFLASGALTTSGSIQTPPDQPISATRDNTKNTGYFAQVQLGWRDALFATAGIRAEENTNFGDDLGTPVSPRVGLSYARELGRATLKLRGSYGRAIRPPPPGLKVAAPPSGLANPLLGPERQRGWDAGLDAAFGSRSSLSVTYFDQTADDLIQQVLLPDGIMFQAQNIGRVRNTGVEVEGSLNVGLLQIKGQYGYVRSRVDRLAPGYVGELRVGDQAALTPRHTAGASVSFTPAEGTSLHAGLSYVGSRNALDVLALFSCFGGTATCRDEPGFRGYFVEYPGFVKLSANVTQQLTRWASGFVAVENLTNDESDELFNNNAVFGRITTVGIRVQY